MTFRDSLLRGWQHKNSLSYVLWPLSVLYRALFFVHKTLYAWGILSSYKASVPVIVVGNLTVGGTGKTPLVIYLVELLREQGFKPAVISRGYHGKASKYPLLLTPDTNAVESGDEPALIVQRTGVPMAVGPNRGDNIEALLASHSVDVIISDDGLQHFALQRDIEICLLDETVSTNNTFLLPAGPYRESLSRLSRVDIVVVHQQQNQSAASMSALDAAHYCRMSLTASAPQALLSKHSGEPFDDSKPTHAVAGIGQPQRFFNTCEQLGLSIVKHDFPDHHTFVFDDINFDDDLAVLMTEKDAVKCSAFAGKQHWFLPVDATLSPNFATLLLTRLNEIVTTQQSE